MILFLGLALLFSCKKDNENKESSQEYSEQDLTWAYVNTFARNGLNLYYLWQADIASALDSDKWDYKKNPIEKVSEIRYKDDRWTMLTDDFSSFYGSVSGTGKTLGFDFILYKYGNTGDYYCAVVTFTYENSPARTAGLKRGDVITKMNGSYIPASSYSSFLSDALYSGKTLTVEKYDGTSATIIPAEMYENPVHTVKVIEADGEKIGYIHYTSFTLLSCNDLVSACKKLKEEGVKELILDLRYNGGGFVLTEEVFASMLVPEANVKAGDVLSTMVYNEGLTEYFKKNDIETKSYLGTSFSYTDDDGVKQSVSTSGANLGVERIYAIVSSGSASASEALLGEIKPYTDLTILGKQTHGKYCSGLMLEAPEFYSDYADQLGKEYSENGKKYTDNWGLYVMYGRFADKDGYTLCMPDGIVPEYDVADNPLDGYDLGDPEETMLAAALKIGGYTVSASASGRKRAVSRSGVYGEAEPFRRPGFGVFLSTKENY